MASGDKACSHGIQESRSLLQEVEESTDGDENHDSAPARKATSHQRSYMVGRVALRTVFFDTKLLDAVTSGPPAAIKQVKPRYIA